MSSESERRKQFEAVAEEVYEPLQRYLRRRTRAADAEDVLADVMLILWRRLDEIPKGRALPWSYGIARRTIANLRRGEMRHLRLVQRMESQRHQTNSPDPSEDGPDPDLAAALDSLSENDRDLLHLWAWEQLEPREIASVLDISVNAATLRLSRARKKLADSLSRQNRSRAGHESIEGT